MVENDLEGALQVVRTGWGPMRGDRPCWALVLLDLCFYTGQVTAASNRETVGMPEGRPGDSEPHSYFGLRLLEALHQEASDLPVIMLSSHSREEVSREFSRRGALGFLPREADDSPHRLGEYIVRHGLIPDEMEEIVGKAPALLLALRAARRAAPGCRHVLIRGERGSGKELLAQFMHRHSQPPGERGRPFVVVNSAGLSRDLFTSTLFGHRKGSFTGALADRTGAIMRAHGGDLFLDEIGTMPAEVQAGLLRVLEYGEVEPVGAETIAKVDTRFLSATNEDIEARAAWGEFRSDLLDRLRLGGTIYVPPLRERLEDVPLLVEQFVRDAEARCPGAMSRQVDAEALARLKEYDWPGNVRELAVCIANAVRENPDVEHLVPVHLRLGAAPKSALAVGVTPAAPIAGRPARRAGGMRLDELVALLKSFSFEQPDGEELAGHLPELQASCAGCWRAT